MISFCVERAEQASLNVNGVESLLTFQETDEKQQH